MPGAAADRSDALAALFARAEEGARRWGCAAQVAVARGGELLGFGGFGSARHGAGPECPATIDTLFSLFSVTKAITASAAWVLLQEGRLRLGERVAERIPEFAENGKAAVTVEQLLTHTAGFPSARFPPADWQEPARRLRHFARWRLEWEPGSRFVYHPSSSMWVLAELITRATGRDYRVFVQERILQPLGLASLFLGLPAEENARVADLVAVGAPAGAAGGGASPVDAPALEDEMVEWANRPESRALGVPGGGAIGAAGDVARFYQALLADAEGRGPGIWQPAVLRDAWTPRAPGLTDPMTRRPALRGLGVVVAGERDKIWRGFPEACSPRSFGHMGAGGQISWADPDSGLSFAYCTSGALRDPVRQGGEGLRLSSLAAACA